MYYDLYSIPRMKKYLILVKGYSIVTQPWGEAAKQSSHLHRNRK